jgi:guanine nucleotide-binding protein subunit alpha
MQTLIMAANEWDLKFDKDHEPMVDAILKAQTDLTPDMADYIGILENTNTIKEVLKRANELQIPGGAAGAMYFFEHCKRFSSPDFQPTTDDIIRAKMRTTGISEVQFKVGGVEFTMVDVGGQRSERRKWLHCFGDVTAVIFLVAMNEYDMVLEEDNKTNRMEESLKLFQKLTGSQWFDSVPFVLFLNKSDLFAERLKTSPLKDTFIDYEEFIKATSSLSSASDEDRGYEYIKAQYVNNFAGAKLYPFRTCAIDKDNCQKVFLAVKDAVLSSAMGMAGI